MGKASVSNITVPLSLVVVPKALAMARLSVVASPFAIFAPSASLFCPLVPYYHNPPPGWHRTAHHRLAPRAYCSPLAGIPSARWLRSPPYPPRLLQSSSVTPSRGIALPLWLPPTPWSNDVITGAAVVHGSSVGPQSSGFQTKARSLSSPSGPRSEALAKLSFVQGSLPKGLGLSTCTFLWIVSLCVWGISILGARWRGLFLWFRGVWFFLLGGEAGGCCDL